MHHHIEGTEFLSARPAAPNFANPPFAAMPDHRVADLAARGNAQTRRGSITRVAVKAKEGAVLFTALSIAAQVIGALP